MQKFGRIFLTFCLFLLFGVAISFATYWVLSQIQPGRQSVEVADTSNVGEAGFEASTDTSESMRIMAEAFQANPSAIRWSTVQSPFYIGGNEPCFIDVVDGCVQIPVDTENSNELSIAPATAQQNTNYWYRWGYGRIAAQTGAGLYAFYQPYTSVDRPLDHPNYLVASQQVIYGAALQEGLNPVWVYTLVDTFYEAAQQTDKQVGVSVEVAAFPVHAFVNTYAEYRRDPGAVPESLRVQIPAAVQDSPTHGEEAVALLASAAHYLHPEVFEYTFTQLYDLEFSYLESIGYAPQTVLSFAAEPASQGSFYTMERDATRQWVLCRDEQAFVCTQEVPQVSEDAGETTAVLPEVPTEPSTCQPVPFLSNMCTGYFIQY